MRIRPNLILHPTNSSNSHHPTIRPTTHRNRPRLPPRPQLRLPPPLLLSLLRRAGRLLARPPPLPAHKAKLPIRPLPPPSARPVPHTPLFLPPLLLSGAAASVWLHPMPAQSVARNAPRYVCLFVRSLSPHLADSHSFVPLVRWPETLRTLQGPERRRVCLRSPRSPVQGKSPLRDRSTAPPAALQQFRLQCPRSIRTMGGDSAPLARRSERRADLRMVGQQSTLQCSNYAYFWATSRHRWESHPNGHFCRRKRSLFYAVFDRSRRHRCPGRYHSEPSVHRSPVRPQARRRPKQPMGYAFSFFRRKPGTIHQEQFAPRCSSLGVRPTSNPCRALGRGQPLADAWRARRREVPRLGPNSGA